MSKKYCPILTKLLESHQNPTFCLEEQCAWWESSYQECVLRRIGRSLSYLEGNEYE